MTGQITQLTEYDRNRRIEWLQSQLTKNPAKREKIEAAILKLQQPVYSEAEECLSLFGSLERARQAMTALVIVENQYDSVESAMEEHASLFDA